MSFPCKRESHKTDSRISELLFLPNACGETPTDRKPLSIGRCPRRPKHDMVGEDPAINFFC